MRNRALGTEQSCLDNSGMVWPVWFMFIIAFVTAWQAPGWLMPGLSISAITVGVVLWIGNRRNERISRVSNAYFEILKTSDLGPLATLFKAGASELSRRELKAVRRRIVHRGKPDPNQAQLVKDDKLSDCLKWCRKHNYRIDAEPDAAIAAWTHEVNRLCEQSRIRRLWRKLRRK